MRVQRQNGRWIREVDTDIHQNRKFMMRLLRYRETVKSGVYRFVKGAFIIDIIVPENNIFIIYTGLSIALRISCAHNLQTKKLSKY